MIHNSTLKPKAKYPYVELDILIFIAENAKETQIYVPFHNFFIAINLTSICCVYKEKFVKNAVSLYLFSFFANTPFTEAIKNIKLSLKIVTFSGIHRTITRNKPNCKQV